LCRLLFAIFRESSCYWRTEYWRTTGIGYQRIIDPGRNCRRVPSISSVRDAVGAVEEESSRKPDRGKVAALAYQERAVPKAARTRTSIEQSKICNTACDSLPYLKGLRFR
jgi:hypothetical protein